jgi:indole-3-glycerol phosphate synthase
LRRFIPEKIFAVSESGIASPEDAIRLKRSGFNAILVGESLMRQKSPSLLLASFRSRR